MRKESCQINHNNDCIVRINYNDGGDESDGDNTLTNMFMTVAVRGDGGDGGDEGDGS